MIVETIIDEKDAQKMISDLRFEKGMSFTPIFTDDAFYIDAIFGFEKFDRLPMYFRVLNGNPYSGKADRCIRINVRKCKFVLYDDREKYTISKRYLMKVLNSKCETELFDDNTHTVWECIIESLFCGLKMDKRKNKLKKKLIQKIPDYTKLPD